jgi:hypothetical protein
MRKVPGKKSFIENQNTYFISSNVFPKIVPFMGSCGRIWESGTEHRC